MKMNLCIRLSHDATHQIPAFFRMFQNTVQFLPDSSAFLTPGQQLAPMHQEYHHSYVYFYLWNIHLVGA